MTTKKDSDFYVAKLFSAFEYFVSILCQNVLSASTELLIFILIKDWFCCLCKSYRLMSAICVLCFRELS
jgi:hypothetical protein